MLSCTIQTSPEIHAACWKTAIKSNAHAYSPGKGNKKLKRLCLLREEYENSLKIIGARSSRFVRS